MNASLRHKYTIKLCQIREAVTAESVWEKDSTSPRLPSLWAVARLQTTRADDEDVVLHSNVHRFFGEMHFKASWKFCVHHVKAEAFTGNIRITSLIFKVANQ